MKKLFYLVLVLCFGFIMVGCNKNNDNDDRPTLVVGMECDYAPFNWTESKKTDSNYPIDGTNLYADGYDVQIAKKICDELDYRLVVKAIEWTGLIAALEAGQIDCIIAGMSDTEDRRISVDFTDSYYESTHVLVMKKTSLFVNGKTKNDFVGANLVGQVNTLYDTLIDQLVGVNHMTALEDVPNIIMSIEAERADITILEEPVAIGIVNNNPSLCYIKLTDGFNVSKEDVAVSIAVKKGNIDLNEKISNILKTISVEERNQIMQDAIARNNA